MRPLIGWFLGAWLLSLSACLRLGYDEALSSKPDVSAAADGSVMQDAASSMDASMQPDAAMDAAMRLDAATSGTDASYANDASLHASAMDASTPLDAASSLDAGKPTSDAAASDAAATCTSNLSLDYCTHLPQLPAAPVLDGKLDCGPSLIDLPPVAWTSSLALPSDNHARYAAAWRPDGLYFYVEVDDAKVVPAHINDKGPWCGDGVELYVDNDAVYTAAPNYDPMGTIQLVARAPAVDETDPTLAVDGLYDTSTNSKPRGKWLASGHVSVFRANGYALEGFVTKTELYLNSWTLSAGGKVGFDIAINVSADSGQKTGCGTNLGQYYLRVSSLPCTSDACRPYSEVAAFCTPTLD